MGNPGSRFTSPTWLRLPRRTARLRLTTLYGGLFLLCGAALVAITYLLVKHAMGGTSGTGPPGQVRIPPSQLSGKLPRILAAVAQQQSASDLNQLLIQSGIALAIVSVVAIVLGWLVAGRVLRPLSTITATARRISASNLHERLALQGPDDELKDLGDTLDALFARLEASFEAQRHFVASASHELRSPVTRERTLLQVALADPAATSETWRSTSQDVLASNAEQERLIEALLTLATSESGLDQREPVDLSVLTDDILLALRPDINRLGLLIEAAIQPAVLDGDPLLLERLVANLIDNAVRHNVPGGRVEIATGMEHGRAILTVSNTGAVIPPGEVDRLFQPFQRLDRRRAHHTTGHGLGLSIVRAIAVAHGATLTARALPDGGLTIDVTFPAPTNPDGASSKQSLSHRLRSERPARARPTAG